MDNDTPTTHRIFTTHYMHAFIHFKHTHKKRLNNHSTEFFAVKFFPDRFVVSFYSSFDVHYYSSCIHIILLVVAWLKNCAAFFSLFFFIHSWSGKFYRLFFFFWSVFHKSYIFSTLNRKSFSWKTSSFFSIIIPY